MTVTITKRDVLIGEVAKLDERYAELANALPKLRQRVGSHDLRLLADYRHHEREVSRLKIALQRFNNETEYSEAERRIKALRGLCGRLAEKQQALSERAS